MITDFIPQELQKIEYLIRMKQARLRENMTRKWALMQEEKGMNAELAVLEEKKYRLLSGRNI